MKKIIQVLGPTCVGKSKVAIKLAKFINGEIISADSMQVYKDFDIGTDKVNNVNRQNIPHYLIDVFSDCSQFNASIFLKKSFEVSEEIIERGNIPVVCGGTALYLKTMIKGIFPESKEKRISREKLNEIVHSKGLLYLWNKLKHIDPYYAENIGKNDRIRIIRAMEIYYNNGIPPSEIFKRTETPFAGYEFIRIGLIFERDELYKRIENRVDNMINRGLVEEVKRLRVKYPLDCPPFKSVGYREILLYLDKKIGIDETKSLIKQRSRNFAKRQLSWFRHEKDINWFNPDEFDGIEKFIKEKLGEDIIE